MQKTLKKTQKGFTLIELLIVIAVIAILAAIAIPNLLSSRKAANESSAISSVRTLITAQETYRSRNGSYADDNAALVTAGLIDATLDPVATTTGKSGYLISTAAVTGSETTSYTVEAEPLNANTGTRSFSADQSGVIRSYASLTVTGTGTPID